MYNCLCDDNVSKCAVYAMDNFQHVLSHVVMLIVCSY